MAQRHHAHLDGTGIHELYRGYPHANVSATTSKAKHFNIDLTFCSTPSARRPCCPAQCRPGLLGPKDLHSQTLLTTFCSTTISAPSLKLPNLLQAMFDEGLYTESTGPGPNAQRNFLDTLVRHQIGVALTRPPVSPPSHRRHA